MIHFDFIVTDEEAETIFDSIQDQIIASTRELFLGVNLDHKDWHRGRITFLKELKVKMTNSKVS